MIVDDAPLARQRILTLLATKADVEIVGEYANGSQAVAAVKDAKAAHKPLKRLVIKSAGRVFFLRADEIDWIEAARFQFIQVVLHKLVG
jgi:DNA-binding NarL/FixJ family response regulator